MILYLIHSVASWLINAYLFVLFVRMILDWANVLAPTWRYIRPLPLGAVYLDVSFIVLYFLLVVLQVLV